MVVAMQPDEMKALRKSIAMTQEVLAEQIGMSRSAIVEMEAGRATIEKRTELAIRYVVEVQGRVQSSFGIRPPTAPIGDMSLDQLIEVLDRRYAKGSGL